MSHRITTRALFPFHTGWTYVLARVAMIIDLPKTDWRDWVRFVTRYRPEGELIAHVPPERWMLGKSHIGADPRGSAHRSSFQLF
jgi:hypothetical protein